MSVVARVRLTCGRFKHTRLHAEKSRRIYCDSGKIHGSATQPYDDAVAAFLLALHNLFLFFFYVYGINGRNATHTL